MLRGRRGVLRGILRRVTLRRVALWRIPLWRVPRWRIGILSIPFLRITLRRRNTDRGLLLVVVTHNFCRSCNRELFDREREREREIWRGRKRM